MSTRALLVALALPGVLVAAIYVVLAITGAPWHAWIAP